MKIGVDLGGTKTEIIVLSDDNTPIFSKRIASPRNEYSATIQCIVNLVKEASTTVFGSHNVDSIGVATPGAVSSTSQLIKNSNSVWLNNKPFHTDLSLALNCKVYIANDANCMALSEACDGAGSNANTVFGIILGTGCGAGITINKHIYAGKNGVAGEWGHNQLPWMNDDELIFAKTQTCYCGKNGCIEQFLSGTGFARYYNFCNGFSTNLKSEEIFAIADTGDVLANKCIELYEVRLAKSLGHIINILDPDIIVAAGGMSNIERIYHNVNKHLNNWVFGHESATKMVKSQHGDASGVRGAAWLNQ